MGETDEKWGLCMKAMVIMNPTSGKEQAGTYKEQIVEQLSSTYEVIVKETQKEHDATIFAREACEEKYEVVVLVGGDGTVHEGIEGIAEQAHRPIVGVVPLGTVNDFARALRLPLEPEEAITYLGKQTKAVDIGKVNEQYFVNLLAVGSLPDAVGDVSIEQKTALGAFAYFFEGAKAAIANETYTLTLQYDDKQEEMEAMLFLVALTDSVASFRNIATDAEVDDGLLHCYVIKAGSLLDTTRVMTTLFAGDFSDDTSVHYFTTNCVDIASSEPYALNVDGDMMGEVPARIEVLKQHIHVFHGLS